jgi:hypothetical protein
MGRQATVPVVEPRDPEAALGQRGAQRLGPPHHLVIQAVQQQQRLPARVAEILVGDLDIAIWGERYVHRPVLPIFYHASA